MGDLPERRKPLRALKAHPGPTCLDLMAGPGLILKALDSSRPGAHRLVVLPASLDFEFLDHLREIPDWAWEPARREGGRLVFDASLEGHRHAVKDSHALHRVLQRKRIPRANAVYLTQDRGYAEAYRRTFAGEPQMRILVYDYWIRAVAGEHMADGEEVFETRLAAWRVRPRRRERRFLSLNHTLRPPKILFLLRLLDAGLWDRGFVSTGGLKPRLGYPGFAEGELEAELDREPRLGALVRALAPLLPRLDAIGSVAFTAPGARSDIRPAMDQALPEYGRSWFSVVTETEMDERPLRITEKPLKPLMNFHPFLVLGNPGSLDLLRGYGFRSFPGLFDESYDGEPDPARRFEAVFRQVERLCGLEEAELERLERAAEDAVLHNARQALVGLPRLFRERLDPDLIGRILAPAEIQPPQSDRTAQLA